jgi:hypothetical protein
MKNEWNAIRTYSYPVLKMEKKMRRSGRYAQTEKIKRII